MKIEHPYQIPSSERRDDIRVLPFLENGMEYIYCFILFNPFYKRKNRLENFKQQKPRWIEGSKSEIVKDYEIFTWTDFLNQSSIKDIKEVFHSLYVTDHNYAKRFQKVKKSTWEKFQKTVVEEQLIPNSDGFLSVLLIDKVLVNLQELGYEKVKLYDVWTEQKQTNFTPISDLLKSEEEFPSEFRLVTDDKNILFYQEFDHYETFIFAKDLKILNSLIELADFEGFFATKQTTLLWNEVEYGENDEVIKIETW